MSIELFHWTSFSDFLALFVRSAAFPAVLAVLLYFLADSDDEAMPSTGRNDPSLNEPKKAV